jgi:hypothetical protein
MLFLFVTTDSEHIEILNDGHISFLFLKTDYQHI